MKHIKLIETLYKKLMEKASYSKENKVSVAINRRGTEIYSINYLKDTKFLELKHYGTTTIIYSFELGKLLYHYGESVSDRDSMNTLMNTINVHDYHFRYGPNMGFLMEYDNETYDIGTFPYLPLKELIDI